MVNLEDFVDTIDEGTRQGWYGSDFDSVEDVMDAPVRKAKDVKVGKNTANDKRDVSDAERAVGKSAKINGSGGTFDIIRPEDRDKDGITYQETARGELTKNQRRLANRFESNEPFMFIGKAGWAKTAFIVDVAQSYGYTIITVYLDKAQPSDLGGIPVPVEDEETNAKYVDYLLPKWALYMLAHPKDKFLLFFDEMNQAAPDVQNALMPIVLRRVICGIQFDNFLPGAAGNFESENSSVSKLSAPLKSRFKPLVWETGTESEWAAHFRWAHKKYDAKIGADVIDKTAQLQDYWLSPRDITDCIYNWCEHNQKPGKLEPEDMYEELVENAVDKEKFKEGGSVAERELEQFSEFLINWSDNGGKEGAEKRAAKEKEEEEEQKSKLKGFDQIDKTDKAALIKGLEQGYVFNSKANDPENGDDNKYLCSVEGAIAYPDGDEGYFNPSITGITAEYLHRIIDEMEANGKTPKYQTDKEGWNDALKNGWWTVRRIGNTEDYEAVPCKDAKPK